MKTTIDASGTAVAEVGSAGSYYVLVEDEYNSGYETDDYSFTATDRKRTGRGRA